MMLILTIGLRHNLSIKAVEDIFRAINLIFKNEKTVPQTKYKIRKYFPIQNEDIKKEIYCPGCRSHLGEQVEKKFQITCSCGLEVDEKSCKVFISLNFASQLKNILENKVTNEQINYRFEREKKEATISDIYDGECYKKLCEPGRPFSQKLNFSYTFNYDGCPYGDSSKITIWPKFATLNELPKHLRAANMILIGVWVDENDPDMDVFFKSFVKNANRLSKHGVEWKKDNGEMVTSKIIPGQSCVDSPARSRGANMLKFNG